MRRARALPNLLRRVNLTKTKSTSPVIATHNSQCTLQQNHSLSTSKPSDTSSEQASTSQNILISATKEGKMPNLLQIVGLKNNYFALKPIYSVSTLPSVSDTVVTNGMVSRETVNSTDSVPENTHPMQLSRTDTVTVGQHTSTMQCPAVPLPGANKTVAIREKIDGPNLVKLMEMDKCRLINIGSSTITNISSCFQPPLQQSITASSSKPTNSNLPNVLSETSEEKTVPSGSFACSHCPQIFTSMRACCGHQRIHKMKQSNASVNKSKPNSRKQKSEKQEVPETSKKGSDYLDSDRQLQQAVRSPSNSSNYSFRPNRSSWSKKHHPKGCPCCISVSTLSSTQSSHNVVEADQQTLAAVSKEPSVQQSISVRNKHADIPELLPTGRSQINGECRQHGVGSELIWKPGDGDKLTNADDLHGHLSRIFAGCKIPKKESASTVVEDLTNKNNVILPVDESKNSDVNVNALTNDDAEDLRVLDSQIRVVGNLWFKYEVRLFEEAILKFGKIFFKISDWVKTRSPNQCVEFYYQWKRTLEEFYPDDTYRKRNAKYIKNKQAKKRKRDQERRKQKEEELKKKRTEENKERKQKGLPKRLWNKDEEEELKEKPVIKLSPEDYLKKLARAKQIQQHYVYGQPFPKLEEPKYQDQLIQSLDDSSRKDIDLCLINPALNQRKRPLQQDDEIIRENKKRKLNDVMIATLQLPVPVIDTLQVTASGPPKSQCSEGEKDSTQDRKKRCREDDVDNNSASTKKVKVSQAFQ
uniref:Uncharacterized protein LOC102801314 n=1 Tax=Saccoglossus kowalevskii TaxID=10224 RepID=A0ABM0M2D6_SACKO|nr:PREDICTED: uncharacterized protein LOC102801314 [Saccoglossus kowalevskii]